MTLVPFKGEKDTTGVSFPPPGHQRPCGGKGSFLCPFCIGRFCTLPGEAEREKMSLSPPSRPWLQIQGNACAVKADVQKYYL